MKILHVISSLNPAYGGLAAWLVALTPPLVALGHESEVVCVDDPREPFLAAFPGVVHAMGPSRFSFAYSPKLVPWLRANGARFDAVVVHGLWQFHTAAVRRALSGPGLPPYFVFSHGMLDPWFQKQYPRKHLKKLAYWTLIERQVLRDASAVFFTCEQERLLAQHSFPGYRCRERVVAFGTIGASGSPEAQRTAFYTACPELAKRPFWLFLGRIHLKKGVDHLLEAYAILAKRPGGEDLPTLAIAGPAGEASYLEQLKKQAVATCPPGSVVWPGMLTGEVKWGSLRAAEAFVLPSHQENFGIAVAEAMSCDTPVLISDQVNIWREIEADHAGLVAPDTVAGTRSLLERWLALDASKRAAMRVAAGESYRRRYEIGAVASLFVDALREMIATGSNHR